MHMRTRVLRRVAIAAVAALTTAIGAADPAFADAANGSVSGQFVDSFGNPIAGASVQLVNTATSDLGGSTTVDASGHYSVADVPPGNYYVNFQFSGLTMYSGNTADLGRAVGEDVTAGADTVVDEQALPTGTLKGTLTDEYGSPIAYASVSAASATMGTVYTSTGAAGTWSATVFSAPDYLVAFYLPSGLTEYAPEAGGDQADANLYWVGAGQIVTVNDQVGGVGWVSGTFTGADGQPVVGEYVYVDYFDDYNAGFTTTDSDGHYTVPAFDGYYVVSFSDGHGQTQWAYGATTRAKATGIVVDEGSTTEVDDTAVGGGSGGQQTGTVTVAPVNGKTGAPVLNFCAYAGPESACTTTGTVVLAGLPVGPTEVDVYPSALKYLYAPGVTVDVVADQNVDVAPLLQPGEVVKTTIVDAVTGAPVSGVCVTGYVVGRTLKAGAGTGCSNRKGVVAIGPFAPGSYALFVTPPQGGAYGSQWIGADGHGTGMEQNAYVLTAKPNRTVTIPNILMDKGGSISGTVTDAVTGLPLSAAVGPRSITPGTGSSNGDSFTDANGQYTVTNLGPYAWPVFTMSNGYAEMWSGNVGNRYAATPVTVTAGATTTYDVALTAGVTLSGTALTADGTPIADGGYIVATNAKTGDPIGFAYADPDGTFSLPILAQQNVRIEYWFQSGDTPYAGFYGGGDGTIVHIPLAGAHVDVVMVPGDNR
jgi:hypothetical protein